MEPVDEFETERDQQRDAEKQERQDRRRPAAGLGDVGADRVGHEEQAPGEHGEVDKRNPEIERVIEVRLAPAVAACGGATSATAVIGDDPLRSARRFYREAA